MIKMQTSLQSTNSPTTILDLNDNCLLEVFGFLDSRELIAAADVCTRFRENAAHFSRTKTETLHLTEHSAHSVYVYSRLRMFGAFVKSVSIDMDGVAEKPRTKYGKRFIEVSSRYCTKMHIELMIYNLDLNDEIAFLMQPLLARVRKLFLCNCKFGKSFRQNLPLWSPELLELEFGPDWISENDGEKAIDRKFPKLESISAFWGHDNVKNIDFKVFMMQNPQLKRVHMKHCKVLNESIFQSIATYVPQIEEIAFNTGDSIDINSIKYIGQLRNLKSFSFEVTCRDDHMLQSILQELASAKNSLESLEIGYFTFGLCGNENKLIELISKFQNLKKLQLRCSRDLKAVHLIKICKHLKNLSEICVYAKYSEMTLDDFLELVRNAEKLQEFVHPNAIGIQLTDDNTIKKLNEIVSQRSEKTKLNLHFGRNYSIELNGIIS